jgi:CheY-like chemotaxis protein
MSPSLKQKLAGMRFLIADEKVVDRFCVGAVLQSCGAAQVVEATNGAEAVEKALSGDYDIIFIDPIMLDAIKEIRVSGYKGAIIALTGRRGSKCINQAMAAGCDDYLFKSEVTREVTLLQQKIIPVAASYKGTDDEPKRRDKLA